MSHARVTQIIGLLRLAPGIMEYIESLDNDFDGSLLTERRLRDVLEEGEHKDQVRLFRKLVKVHLRDRQFEAAG